MTIHPNGVATIDGDTHHGVWCSEAGLIHDKWMAEQVTRHIKVGHLVIQGGANIGTLTRALLDAGARVLAFEPNPKAVECLWHNCGFDSLTVEPFAVSDNFGSVRLHAQENAGATYVSKPLTPIQQGEPFANTVAIDSYNLFPNLILLDVEGYEVSALRGAQKTIARCHPVIICEVNRGALERAGTSDAELFDLLDQCGYSVSVMQPDCRIGDPQYDVLCLPK